MHPPSRYTILIPRQLLVPLTNYIKRNYALAAPLCNQLSLFWPHCIRSSHLALLWYGVRHPGKIPQSINNLLKAYTEETWGIESCMWDYTPFWRWWARLTLQIEVILEWAYRSIVQLISVFSNWMWDTYSYRIDHVPCHLQPIALAFICPAVTLQIFRCFLTLLLCWA